MATKQTLQSWQNGHFGSKIKNAKKYAKNVSTRHCSCSMQKKRLEKTANNRKMGPFRKLAKMATSKGYYSLGKTVTLGQKLKMQRNIIKTFLQDIAVVLCKKRFEKTANIRKMRPF